MAGGGDDKLITRWKEVVTATVSDGEMRGNLAGISLVFADLAGCGLAWKQGLEGWQMTESKVVNEWISQGVAKTKLEDGRRHLIKLLERRFPAMVSAEIFDLIRKQDSLDLLDDWFGAAAVKPVRPRTSGANVSSLTAKTTKGPFRESCGIDFDSVSAVGVERPVLCRLRPGGLANDRIEGGD
jgi:hypothetical protein